MFNLLHVRSRNTLFQPISFRSFGVKIDIPKSKLTISFARSSGPGGQNVNKVNTKVEIRFHVDSATWIPDDIRGRFKELNTNRITKQGEIIFTSEKGRTQEGNMKDCLQKLEESLEEASIPPKERIISETPEWAHDQRIQNKKQKSQVKKQRNWKSDRSVGF